MSTKKLIKALGLIIVVALLAAALPLQAKAATTTVTCTGTGDTALLQSAIDAATNGDTISVTGTCVLDSNITVSKAVTLDGNNKAAKIQVSGTGYRITMTTAGATLQNFEIEKSDKTGEQNIIWINASNITIANNKVHGQFVIGENEVSRAIVISGGHSGLLITGNEFYGLRQPAYISGVTTGTISNNLTKGTKGWVVEQGDMTFTGNTWGTGVDANVFDIAILNTVNPIYYTDVPAMSAANNNAFIEDQRGGVKLLTPVYVDASAPSCTSDCGTARAPYNKIQDGIARVIPGGTVNVAAGTYNENLVINKSLNLIGAGDDLVTVKGVAPTTDAGMVNIVASNVTIDGFKLVAEGYKTIRLNAPSTGVTFSNNTVVGATYDGEPAGGWILFESNYNNAHSNLTITGNVFENNGGQIGVYLNPQITGLTFTNNTFRGEPTSGPVLGIDGMNGTEVITGNSFAGITSPYALFEGFGEFSIVDIFTDNTWPAGYFPIGNKVKIPDTKLLMDPATIGTTDTCTGTHEVYVKVQAVTNLVAYDLDLTYDSSLITVTNVENVGIGGGAPAFGNSFANGVINFGWYVNNGAGNPPTYNGDLDLIKITFQSKGLAGTGAFTIQPTSILVDWPDVFAIPYEITGGATVNFGSIVTNTTAEPNKAYCDLAVAVAEATGGDTLRADVDFTTTSKVILDKALTFDTNLKAVSRTGATSSYDSVFEVNPGGDLTITGGGTLRSSNVEKTLGAAVRIVGGKVGDTVTPAKVTLVNATLSGSYASVNVRGNMDAPTFDTAYPALFTMTGGSVTDGIVVYGNGSELNISGGTVTGWAPIMGNGTVNTTTNAGGTKITISGTAVIDGGPNTCLAIYHPQDGLLTINGGTITGTNGIEMKAGDLVVTGGTILGTGPLAEPTATGSGSTDTGDAILIFNRNGYTGDLNVTISGSPTITSTNAYALREFTLPGETSRLGVAAISGGHFTGGAGAVSFTTVSDTNLDLTGGDYNTDPIAYVYAPYGTYLKTDTRWYIALLPVISSTDFDDQVNLGVQSTFNLTINPSVPGAFNMVFTGYPSETEIVYLGVTYTCVMSGDPAICTITVPVMLTGLSESLPFAITVATATSETPAASYPVTATLHAPAPAYGVTGRDLASLSATVPVASGFAVTGTFSMQGNLSRAGIPVTLTWGGTLVPYGPTGFTTSAISNNFSLSVLYGGTYTITTNQPRYLNLTTASAKSIYVDGPKTLNALMLRGGNVVDNELDKDVINTNDASLIGTYYGQSITTDPDANFDGKVNILDLALVGGNFGLTSVTAYDTEWTP